MFKPELRIDGATIIFTQKFREILEVSYRDADVDLKLEGEWLGWAGTSKHMYVMVILPAVIRSKNGVELSTDSVRAIAERIFRGLEKQGIRNQVERTLPPVPLDEEERKRLIAGGTTDLEASGFEVTIDKDKNTVNLKPRAGYKIDKSRTVRDAKAMQNIGDALRGATISRETLFRSTDI